MKKRLRYKANVDQFTKKLVIETASPAAPFKTYPTKKQAIVGLIKSMRLVQQEQFKFVQDSINVAVEDAEAMGIKFNLEDEAP